MSIRKSHFIKLLYKNWEEKWSNETESHNFFKNYPFTYQKSAKYKWQATKAGDFIDDLNENRKDWALKVSVLAQGAWCDKYKKWIYEKKRNCNTYTYGVPAV